jgi:phosphoribosylformylglycinamidine synthase
MKFAVVVFPGSNCDHDAYHAVKKNLGEDADFLWHKDTEIPKDTDCVILPGGFSYGDYLRCGAIAQFSPVMNEVKKFADRGGYVIGICNGFQVLTETGMLPGALLRNKNLSFICKDVHLKVVNNETPFTSAIKDTDILRLPIAHGEGNYFAEQKIIDELENENRVIFKYANEKGEVVPEANPNGSINNIAGIINKTGNVLGMMPHPERYSDELLGNNDGLLIFKSLAEYLVNNK